MKEELLKKSIMGDWIIQSDCIGFCDETFKHYKDQLK